MSIVESIQKLFKTKSNQPVDSMDIASVGTPVESVAGHAADDASQEAAAILRMSAQERYAKRDFATSRMASDEERAQPEATDLLTLPVLGRRTVTQHQRILLVLLGLAVLVLGTVTFSALNQSGKVAQQLEATGQSLMQSQRLAKSVSQALVGSAEAFPDVRESADVLAKAMRGLKSGEASLGLAPVKVELQPDVEKVLPLVDRATKNAKTVMDQQSILTQVGSALRTINRQSSDLLEIAETVSSLKLQQNSPATEISASGQLVMLTQRIGKSANEFLTMEGVSPEAVFLLGKDLNSFKEIAQGLQDGSPELRLTGSTDAQTRERLSALMALYEQTRTEASAILGNLQGLVSAREAQSLIIADSEPLRRGLEVLQEKLSAQSGVGTAALTTLVLAAAFALLCAAGLARLQLQDSQQRQEVSENQRQEAKSQEQDAKRVNDANQAAILRLMNELQTVAEGDLTQQATVTEDITGAIADSVNYTVEELRTLVSQVQGTVGRVTDTTQQVENTSTELLAASTEQ
ncbi:MAG: type IV pili methyl-accepting chemotaxis transducer N-terminal domain-containing protein, partial [Polaromonas sp.]|nr:type IV pili methyl-accepting chemotaxis transducer N-terminal domain-containing protein [Polaromonas sp.]